MALNEELIKELLIADKEAFNEQSMIFLFKKFMMEFKFSTSFVEEMFYIVKNTEWSSGIQIMIETQKFSEGFIKKNFTVFRDRFYYIFKYQKLSQEFLEWFIENPYYSYSDESHEKSNIRENMIKYQVISENFKYIDIFSIKSLFEYQILSEKFIDEHINQLRFDFCDYLFERQINKTKRSKEFIIRHFIRCKKTDNNYSSKWEWIYEQLKLHEIEDDIPTPYSTFQTLPDYSFPPTYEMPVNKDEVIKQKEIEIEKLKNELYSLKTFGVMDIKQHPL